MQTYTEAVELWVIMPSKLPVVAQLRGLEVIFDKNTLILPAERTCMLAAR